MGDNLDFLSFLDLDISDESTHKEIVGFVLDNLNGMDSEGFKANPVSIISIVNKLNSLLKYKGVVDYESSLPRLASELTESLKTIRKLRSEEPKSQEDDEIVNNSLNREISKCEYSYYQLFNSVTEAYIKLKSNNLERNDYEDFNKIYTPQYSNKKKAVECIEVAITLINTDESLSPKHKKQLVKILTRVIDILGQEHINWTKFFGTIKEAIIVLSALVTIGGSTYQLDNLIKAKEKLEESKNVIEITCINQNYIQYEQSNNLIFIQNEPEQSLLLNEEQEDK